MTDLRSLLDDEHRKRDQERAAQERAAREAEVRQHQFERNHAEQAAEAMTRFRIPEMLVEIRDRIWKAGTIITVPYGHGIEFRYDTAEELIRVEDGGAGTINIPTGTFRVVQRVYLLSVAVYFHDGRIEPAEYRCMKIDSQFTFTALENRDDLRGLRNRIPCRDHDPYPSWGNPVPEKVCFDYQRYPALVQQRIVKVLADLGDGVSPLLQIERMNQEEIRKLRLEGRIRDQQANTKSDSKKKGIIKRLLR